MWKRLKKTLEDPNKPFVHRDFSWLQFNERVLAEAKDEANPLLERLKFLGITASNLDEFFMIRMSSFDREIAALRKTSSKNLDREVRTQSEVLQLVRLFHQKQSNIFNRLTRLLSQQGVQVIRRVKKGTKYANIAEQVFYSDCVGQIGEPEQFSSDSPKQLSNLQTALLFPDGLWLPIPKSLPPTLWIEIEDEEYVLFFLDDLLKIQLPRLFVSSGKPLLIRVIRDADIAVDLEEEDASSLPDAVKRKIRAREFGNPTKILTAGSNQVMSADELSKVFKIEADKIFHVTHPLMLQGSFQFANELKNEKHFKKPKLVFPKFEPSLPRHFKKPSGSFDKILKRDYFIHHPYDSFDAYVNLLQEAVEDPNVISIEQSVYRIDTLSPVTELLKKAASTKRVRVLIEPRARFDEINNIQLAEELRSAGVNVNFAFGKLKLHAKIALFTRKMDKEVQYFTHLSTGNYNAKTARLYTDMAIFTADPVIGEDAKAFFDSVSQNKVIDSFQRLVVAPTKLHRRLISLIQSETQAALAGKPAQIFAKVNTLVDEFVVNQLYEASKAGVKVDLNVRGACSLLPGIPGLSENIRVISIVDRFLEHSRIYYFKNSDIIYLSSADCMPRNFFKRFELAFPVLDARIAQYIKEIVIPTYLDDQYKSWELSKSGNWRRKRNRNHYKETRAQFVFEKLANSNYSGTSLY